MLQLDTQLSLADALGPRGVTQLQLDSLAPALGAAVEKIEAQHQSGALGFLDLPTREASIVAALELGQELRARFENAVVLGIGGSSLGARALASGLLHPFSALLPPGQRAGAQLFFPDNADASTFLGLLDVIDVEKTVFLAVTKSGGTAETWAQLLTLNHRLGAERMRQQVVAVTDENAGALRAVVNAQHWKSLPVPREIGGRFSVFTPVGLLPAAAAGIDCRALLKGAAHMAQRCRSTRMEENPAAQLVAVLFSQHRHLGRSGNVLMPYADALREFADWYVQLWGESLGKGDAGPTPIRAVGATDQHSLLQLLMEGPDDKTTIFIAEEKPRRDLKIPAGFEAQSDVAFLSGHTFHALLTTEQRSTAAALAQRGRPSIRITVDELTPSSLGELMMLWQAATALAAQMYGVNAFDQPGVELSKKYTCGALGRPGYEAFVL
jgi:glucose-6-phosphate isomerase